MTRRTVAALQADLSTGLISGAPNHSFVKDLTDSYQDLDTQATFAATLIAGTNGIRQNTEQVLFSKTSVDMNVTTDQTMTKAGTFTNYIITAIRVGNASTSLTTAAGGIYTAASKGGSAIVASGQAYSALTGATIGLDLTIAAVGKGIQTATPIISLTTGQGGAATADFYVMGVPLS